MKLFLWAPERPVGPRAEEGPGFGRGDASAGHQGEPVLSVQEASKRLEKFEFV